MDGTDRLILARLQDGLPPDAAPFASIAETIGLPEEKLLARIRKLIKRGLIRRIGPVADNALLGRATTLAAMAVPQPRVEEVAAAVSALPSVSHCYLRRANEGAVEYNLWFTLNAASEKELEELISEIGRKTGLGVLSLPAKRTFKLHVRFDPD